VVLANKIIHYGPISFLIAPILLISIMHYYYGPAVKVPFYKNKKLSGPVGPDIYILKIISNLPCVRSRIHLFRSATETRQLAVHISGIDRKAMPPSPLRIYYSFPSTELFLGVQSHLFSLSLSTLLVRLPQGTHTSSSPYHSYLGFASLLLYTSR